MDLNTAVINRLRNPITQTWSIIAADLLDGFAACGEEMDNEMAIEGTIDANRLHLTGRDKEADELVTALVVEHGYTVVLKFLSAHFNLV